MVPIDSVSQLTYFVAIIPLTLPGFVGNILIVLVWRREKYHPAHLILMTLAMSHNAFMCSFHALHLNFNAVLEIIVFTTRLFIVQCSLVLTAVHFFWTFNPHRCVFFTKRRISAGLFFVFCWSLLLETLPSIIKLSREVFDERTMEVSIEVIGVVLPCFVQGIIVGRLSWRKRSQRRVRAMWARKHTPCTLDLRARSSPDHGHAGHRHLGLPRVLAPSLAKSGLPPASKSTANVKGAEGGGGGGARGPSHGASSVAHRNVVLASAVLRHRLMLERIREEKYLSKAIIIISVLPMFVYPAGLIGRGYFRLLGNSDYQEKGYVVLKAQTDAAMFVHYSYQFFLFLALLPRFRNSVKLELSKLRLSNLRHTFSSAREQPANRPGGEGDGKREGEEEGDGREVSLTPSVGTTALSSGWEDDPRRLKKVGARRLRSPRAPIDTWATTSYVKADGECIATTSTDCSDDLPTTDSTPSKSKVKDTESSDSSSVDYDGDSFTSSSDCSSADGPSLPSSKDDPESPQKQDAGLPRKHDAESHRRRSSGTRGKRSSVTSSHRQGGTVSLSTRKESTFSENERPPTSPRPNAVSPRKHSLASSGKHSTLSRKSTQLSVETTALRHEGERAHSHRDKNSTQSSKTDSGGMPTE